MVLILRSRAGMSDAAVAADLQRDITLQVTRFVCIRVSAGAGVIIVISSSSRSSSVVVVEVVE